MMGTDDDGGGQVCLDVDLTPLAEAVMALRRRLGPAVRMLVSVKADGYGFGARAVAARAAAAGADGIALADRSQAVSIRRSGFDKPILVYAGAPIDAEAAHIAESHDLILTVLHRSEVETLARHATRCVSVAIKVDVGAERLGVTPREAASLATLIDASPTLKLAVVNAHPTLAADAPTSVLEAQYRNFCGILALPPLAGRDDFLRLFGSSKVLLRSDAMSLNAVDPGQMLYEAPPGRWLIQRMWTRLLQVRDVTRDFAIEHAPFPMAGVKRIGVIPYGRVDAAGRCDLGRGSVRGRSARFLGPPNLEYTRVDLTDVPDAVAGDEVTLIGDTPDGSVTLGDVMAKHGVTRETDFALPIPARVRRRQLT